MANPAVRLRAIEIVLYGSLALLLARAAQVQLVQGRRWAAEAQAQRTERVVLEPRRGAITDRDGTPLALSHETYHVGIAPNELRRRAADAALIARQLRVAPRALERALRRRYAWFAGPYSARDVEPLRAVRGVHLEPVPHRFYPAPDFARAVIGRVGTDGHGASGLERTLDSLLAGRPGAAVVVKDRAGREYASPARVITDRVAGHEVILTLDAELQEIAQRALDDALDRLDADGGDVVMLDPATGEVLALASRRRDGSSPASAVTDVFEPGSVAKIFAAAALLEREHVRPGERVSGEGGRYRMPERTITDDHPLPSLTLADAIRVSSNIAMAKFASRLAPAEQFAMLRAFGFGAPTGLELAAESPGRLRRPDGWTRLSAASLAMGYELAVTPLQLAAAYAVIGNGGVLLQPALVREIRDPTGRVVFRHRPAPVRRVVERGTADRLRELLRGVVEGGTGSAAALTTFGVAAKTGTSRRVVDGRYAEGLYTASFAALFPADRPQLAMVVKLDNPRAGGYTAARTAAPVTRAVLEQALAARDVAIDRARLGGVPGLAPGARGSAVDAATLAEPLPDDDAVAPYVVTWPHEPARAGPVPRRAVPDVRGRPLRAAALALHRRGFQVQLRGWGRAARTVPAAGDSAAVGSSVTLFAESP